MTTTREKYNRLCDMNIVDKSKYDLNARIDLIIQEILNQLQQWEQDALDIYGPLKNPLKKTKVSD